MRQTWLVVGLIACGTPSETETDDTDVVVETDAGDDDAPDPQLVQACVTQAWVARTCTGCHFGGNHLDLRFDALEELVSKNREFDPSTPLLVPGDADASLLVRKVEARAGLVTLEEGEGDPMPPDRSISEADASLIRDWVEAGALVPEGC